MIPNLEEQITIEEILIEAHAFGLKREIVESADVIWSQRKNEEEFTLLDAYHLAFHDWVK